MAEQNTLEENKALICRWFEEVWNKGRADAIPEMFADDGIAHGLSDDPAQPLRGSAGFLPFHGQFRGAFPTAKLWLKIRSPGATWWRLAAVSRQAPAIISAWRRLTRPLTSGMAITRIRDGKIGEAWNNFDFMKMYRQLERSE
jgi:hypothetical protein